MADCGRSESLLSNGYYEKKNEPYDTSPFRSALRPVWAELSFSVRAWIVVFLAIGFLAQLVAVIAFYANEFVEDLVGFLLAGLLITSLSQVLFFVVLNWLGVGSYPVTVGGIFGAITSLFLLPALLAIGITKAIIVLGTEQSALVCESLVTSLSVIGIDTTLNRVVFFAKTVWALLSLPFRDELLFLVLFESDAATSFWDTELRSSINYSSYMLWLFAGSACVLGYYDW